MLRQAASVTSATVADRILIVSPRPPSRRRHRPRPCRRGAERPFPPARPLYSAMRHGSVTGGFRRGGRVVRRDNFPASLPFLFRQEEGDAVGHGPPLLRRG